MKRFLFLVALASSFSVAKADETQNRKVYECIYVDELPDGVIAWQQSGLLKEKRETRFVPYDSKAAENLILDATADRGVTKEESAPARQTAFRAAYDERGVGIYIEAAEPLIREMLDAAVDPSSPARREAFEVFLSPGLSEVPYYQLFIKTVAEETNFFDWGSPHRHYRSLKPYARVEAKPLKTGFGISIFVPWEALYEHIPREDGYWRFTAVRWMPFGKAGGVTWGGKVHETGRFGLLHFHKPNEEQLFKIEKRLSRYAWFQFLAKAKAATRLWSDEKVGDREFYQQALQPVIDESTRLGESFGPPDDWKAEVLTRIKPVEEDWLEFDYKVGELRTEYLLKKRIEDQR